MSNPVHVGAACPPDSEVARAVGAASISGDVTEADRSTFGVAVDATGVPAAIEAAFASLARGGRLLIFGVASADVAVSLLPFRIYKDEITVLGSMAVLNRFGAAADLMAAGAVDTGPMLGPPFALDQFPEALASDGDTASHFAPTSVGCRPWQN